MGVQGISRTAPIGKRFGRVTVISETRRPPGNKPGSPVVDCRCDCGDVRHYWTTNLTTQVEPMCPDCRTKSRASKGQTGHPLFNIWKGIIQRCENPKHTHFDKYGARGIQMCADWRHDFLAFAASMGDRPSPQHTIDRADPDGNYEPGNCRWATPMVQANNRRAEFHSCILWGGRTLTIAEAARQAGISDALLLWRIKRGWGLERAMTTPTRLAKSHPS